MGLTSFYSSKCDECLDWNCELKEAYNDWITMNNVTEGSDAAIQFDKITCTNGESIKYAATMNITCLGK